MPPHGCNGTGCSLRTGVLTCGVFCSSLGRNLLLKLKPPIKIGSKLNAATS